MSHKSGFVNIVGSPNMGKSTLMNKLVGEEVSIITSKAQTTRHRIIGIVNQPGVQVVLSDTPGVLEPHYALQQTMMKAVSSALSDADVILLVTDVYESELNHAKTLEKLQKTATPVIVLINKIDLGNQHQMEQRIAHWHHQLPKAEILPISALNGFNLDILWTRILQLIPENPPYYDTDDYTDRPIRFFVSEIIREKILLSFKQEIPYACEVMVESYEDAPKLAKIRAIIFVERDSQKGILVGHKGEKIKHLGIDSRKHIQKVVGKQVHLELVVKVDKDWRHDERKLAGYGY